MKNLAVAVLGTIIFANLFLSGSSQDNSLEVKLTELLTNTKHIHEHVTALRKYARAVVNNTVLVLHEAVHHPGEVNVKETLKETFRRWKKIIKAKVEVIAYALGVAFKRIQAWKAAADLN